MRVTRAFRYLPLIAAANWKHLSLFQRALFWLVCSFGIVPCVLLFPLVLWSGLFFGLGSLAALSEGESIGVLVYPLWSLSGILGLMGLYRATWRGWQDLFTAGCLSAGVAGIFGLVLFGREMEMNWFRAWTTIGPASVGLAYLVAIAIHRIRTQSWV
jgi:hypothetical protein